MIESFKKSVRHLLHAWKVLYGALLKWIVLSIIIGVSIGVVASVFSYAVEYATEFRHMNPWIVYGMPLGGMLIVALYKYTGQSKNAGTNMVLLVVRSDEEAMPGRVAPLILISTVITHFFGGSSGREGAALQFGASMGDWFGRKIHLNESDRKIVTLAAMSAAFSALFGTPMAAAIFPMEVISVGVMYYGALVPCVLSAFMAQKIAVTLGVRTLATPYLIEHAPILYTPAGIKAIFLAAIFSIVGGLFCMTLHHAEEKLAETFRNRYLRVAIGGAAVAILYTILGTDMYLGLGDEVIKGAFDTPAGFHMFLLKILFTCLTLCAGFKGGEIVPSLFIGATLGSALAPIFGMPLELCTACGMVGVFCSVTNSPISSLLIAFELFGANGMPFFCVVIAICYLLSGYQSLYKEQKIMYSKTENKFIARKTS